MTRLRLTDEQTSKFLFAVQGIGAVFVGIFLAAYLSGLPTTAVLHSEPAFRIPLYIFGVVLLVLVISALVLAALQRKTKCRVLTTRLLHIGILYAVLVGEQGVLWGELIGAYVYHNCMFEAWWYEQNCRSRLHYRQPNKLMHY